MGGLTGPASKWTPCWSAFGACCAAARKRGLHVIARMSPDLNWEDAVAVYPEWFQRDSQGNAIHHVEDARLFRTYIFTACMTD